MVYDAGVTGGAAMAEVRGWVSGVCEIRLREIKSGAGV